MAQGRVAYGCFAMSLLVQGTPTEDGLFILQGYGQNVGTWGTGPETTNWNVADAQLGGSLAIDLTGLTTYTLSDTQAVISYIRLTGTPAGSVTLNIPNQGRQYIFNNQSTETVSPVPYAGTGIPIAAGDIVLCRVDKTQSTASVIILGSSITPILPVPISAGGTGATTAGQALINLGGGTSGIDVFEAETVPDIYTVLGAGTEGIALFQSETSADATALLDDFMGDSGSGGVMGLVPAPSAGDAAAHKVLGAGGTWVVPDYGVIGKLRATTATAITVTATDSVIDVDATAGTVTVTYPLALGTATTQQKVRINKVDTSANQILITSDGSTPIDAISAPATASGQINGWRDVFSNATNLRSAGIG